MKRHVFLLCVAVLLAAAWPAAAANDREAKVYAVTNWPSSGACQGNDVGAWDDMALAWYDEIGDGSVFFKDGTWINNSLRREILCDPDAQSPCDDDARIDDADAALIAVHGFDMGKHWGGLLLQATGGDCAIHAPEGAATDAMFLGDVDLEFLHLSSCNSMDDDNINWTRRMFADVDSATNGQRLHIATGFHGVMAISSGRADDYEDFADDAHDVSISDAWLDNLYDSDVSYNNGTNGAQCPVSFAVSNTPGSALSRLLSERYTNIHSDPTASGAFAYGFYDGCNPVGDDAFNDPNL